MLQFYSQLCFVFFKRLPVVVLTTALFLGCALAPISGQDASKSKKQKWTFDDHVQPIFRQHCSACHNPDRRSGDLDVTSYTALIEGGASGTVIEPGDHQSSYLYSLVNHDEQPQMPPSGQKIPAAEIKLIADWIDGGALENKGSKAIIKKESVELSIVENPTARPAVVPMPARTVLESNFFPRRAPNADTIATSPWAPVVAIGGQKQVLLYNTQTHRLAGVIPFSAGQVNSIRFSRSGQLLAIGGGKPGFSGKVLLWNILNAEPVTWLGDELDTVLACDISPDQSMVVVGGPAKTVKVYSTKTGELIFKLEKHTDWVTAAQFSPDGALLVTGDRNGGLHTWEAMTGRHYTALKGHTEMITSVSWRGDSNLIASASEDDSIRLWELTVGRQIKNWKAHTPGALSVEFSADGRLVSSGRDKTAKLWDQQGKLIRAFSPLDDIVHEVSFCDTTSKIIAGVYGGKVAIGSVEQKFLNGSLPTIVLPMAQQVTDAQEKSAAAWTNLAKHKSEFDAAQKSKNAKQAKVAQLKRRHDDVIASLERLRLTASDTNKEASVIEQRRLASNDEVVQITTALPLVESSLEKITEAIKASPQSAELKQMAEDLTAQLQKMRADVQQLQQQTSQADEQLAQTNQTIAQVDSEIKQANKAIAGLETQLKNQTRALNAANKKSSQAKTKFDQAQSLANSAAEDVEFWEDQIEFKRQLADLKLKLDRALEAQHNRQAVSDRAREVLQSAQAGADAADAELEKTIRATELLKAEIRKLRNGDR